LYNFDVRLLLGKTLGMTLGKTLGMTETS